MSDLSYEQLRSIDPRFEEDVLDVFDFEASVERRNAVGGPAKARVQEQIVFVRQSLE
jgi:argininosuccinate lyase